MKTNIFSLKRKIETQISKVKPPKLGKIKIQCNTIYLAPKLYCANRDLKKRRKLMNNIMVKIRKLMNTVIVKRKTQVCVCPF